MLSRRKHRTPRAFALIVIVSLLVLNACGTRLDRAAIEASAYGTGAAVQGGQSVGALGESGTASSGVISGPGSVSSGEAGTSGGQAAGEASAAQSGGVAGSAGAGESAQAAGGGAGGPIVIGNVGNYSGPAGSAWAPGARGLEVWAAHVNANGGINGREVEVIVADDGSNGAKARSQAQDLVENRGAVALVGSMANATINQLKSYAESANVPLIGGDCSHKAWNTSPMLFNQCASAVTNMYAVVAVGAKLGEGTKFGALICQEAAGCSQAEHYWFDKGMAKKAGLEPVYRAKISIAQPDFTSECIAARNAGVELLTVMGDPDTLARVGASCSRQNFNPQYVQPGQTVNADTPEQPGLSQVVASTPVFPFAGLNTPEADEFAQAWEQYAGDMQMNGASAQGWAAGELFAKAAEKAGSNVTKRSLAEALYSLKNERLGGLTAPLTYKEGSPTPDSRCWFTMQSEGGGWTAPQGDKLMCW